MLVFRTIILYAIYIYTKFIVIGFTSASEVANFAASKFENNRKNNLRVQYN